MRTRPVNPLRVLPLALVCALAACGPQGEPGQDSTDGTTGSDPAAATTGPTVAASSCQPLAGLPSQTGDLKEFLGAAKIAAKGSEGFVEPSGVELTAFERAFTRLLTQGADKGAVADLEALGFTVTGFTDEGTPYLVVEERAARRGGGTFVVNLAPGRDMWIEAPHADSDQGTLEQTSLQLRMLGARALLITGSNRCAAAAATTCDGTTKVCGGKLRVSDVAHYDRNFFTAAHRALRAAFPAAMAVQVHGMETSGVEAAVVSDGTRAAAGASATSVRLRDALNRELGDANGRAFSCNDPSDTGFRKLCGTDNIQGRIDNGAGDACRGDVQVARGTFLHLEQGPQLRSWSGREDHPVTRALATTVACTLGGQGLGCLPRMTAPGC